MQIGKKQARISSLIFNSVTFLLFVIGGTAALAVERIVVTGSSTIAPLMSDIARRYESENSNIEIDVQSGGSSRGIADVRRGIADIGMVSRALKSEEADLTGFTIAKDGLAMIVHDENSISALSDDQIRSIYKGKATEWSEVGGGPGPITVVSKAEGRSTLEVFLEFSELTLEELKPHIIIGDNEQAIKLVSRNPMAIAYVSIGTIEYHMSYGTPIKMFGLGNIPASSATVADGTYHANRLLNLITTGEISDNAKSFISYALGERVEDIIRDYYFIPVAK